MAATWYSTGPFVASNFYSAKNVAERKRKGMVRGTLSL